MNSLPFLRISLAAFLLMATVAVSAQNSNIDKSQADQFIYESLSGVVGDDYEAERVDFKPSSLVKTNEKSVFILPGSHYQLETLRSDCYLRKTKNNNYVVISDLRYPMETFVNQLLNKVKSGHVLQVKHHQYGQKVPLLKTPLQSLFSLFGPTMKSYASVTSVNEKEIEALCDTQMFILGNKVSTLENEIAAYSGAVGACGVTSGSDALIIALMVIYTIQSFTVFAQRNRQDREQIFLRQKMLS